jgi:hypothetical protein
MWIVVVPAPTAWTVFVDPMLAPTVATAGLSTVQEYLRVEGSGTTRDGAERAKRTASTAKVPDWPGVSDVGPETSNPVAMGLVRSGRSVSRSP